MRQADRETILFSSNVLTENGSKKTILVVDDHHENHLILNYYLTGQCYIQSAMNGCEAMEMLSSKIFGLVILDIDLGQGPDGFELLNFIRSHQKTKHLPVLAFSSYVDNYSSSSFMQAGFDAVLGKPFRKSDLIHRLNKIL